MLFRKHYKTPPGFSAPGFTNSMETQTHLLIAGATGSGKSVLESLLILDLIGNYTPGTVQLILIDPKRVSLLKYKKLPHCLLYADTPETIYNAFRAAENVLDDRFRKMQKRGEELFPGSHVFIIVDEYADIMTTDKKRLTPIIQRIAQTGRAAKIHLLCCTQRPTRDIISGAIAVNIDSRVALRTVTRQDSVNIIRRPGAELLPRFGRGVYVSPDFMGAAEIEIPYTEPEKIKKIVDYWTK